MAIDIRARDMLKLKTASDLGFSVLTVWEDEFKASKIDTIKKVKEWILQEQQLKA
jgi:G:T-mismatch repair DNA endonuclease (very short patch repair protein)